ncbi:dol-P-Man:Man(6)GlcNAc(2)-PP-Dol alpha-1,2-mannosyltransferase [Arachis ipaensis]|uniref:dol-P-Man:Man(6)GlcNAc(2)-PP-Dol alpha-1,2-mannosyltransferase n=1 Tax=Arachis ipaensis TaxID=130454 RepID=UPI0007AF920A|nr:dol-P-Man:Man(6)GlcNAc(2)-PP-Dol alpha-1,2-mannosyltransferase [Arachis ipaensis]XP_025643862.1 dol-P-Man:Man(6)GlcNAc(2)-PP-Dol alpha-1,2-mannosyltransferase [Arachis hypogaea]QHO00725.1 Dol-P-Man:Man(6)GlcNAc(2)-PP-Dol alpha-1,2-mannosyltransferase [Arachis hypogaea]
MAMVTRQRRSQPSDPSPSTYTKLDKANKSDGGGAEDEKGLGWFLPFVALGMLRYMSASSNIIHDCDEVFNYWEPLHFLLYKTGFQTWEYSSQFALRSYLYLLFHELVGRPASWLFAEEKVRVFVAVRLFLGLLSVITETVLVVALSRKYGKRLASYALAMLCLTSGCFFASTSFLPSSFSMYAMSLASGLFLLDKPAASVAVAATGVILGWPFSILAFLPVTLYSLSRKFNRAFIAGAVTSIILLALSTVIDFHYYGRWTSSVLNILIYNVAGGGESHLYGTEGPFYYLRNGFNNFNFCFLLALLFLGILPIARKKYAPDLLIVVSPIYIWLGFMSLQPHKEERFLYPIYPLICVAASAVIESFPDLFRDKYNPRSDSIMVKAAKILRPVILSLILCASHARTFSLIHGYSAPMEVYKILEHHDDAGTGSVLCVGSEWHRFPSSFFIPNYVSEVRWIDDGFRGLLPFPFNSTLGGTASAPSYFNNKNKASNEQYLHDIDACTFLVELQLKRPYLTRGSDMSTWEAIAAIPYLDRELSPSLYRSFFIPYLWQDKNVFGMYKLLKRIPK